MPSPPPHSPLGLEFIDTLPGSPSFGIVARRIDEFLEQAAAGGPSASRWRLSVDRLLRKNPPALVLQLAHHLGRATLLAPELLRPRVRALVVGWELEELTTTLRNELSTADILLGISEFNSTVYRRHFPATPVLTVPVCPDFPVRPAQDRARWGIPEDCVAFLNVFNPVSGFDRKNPIDAHAAFQLAFEGRRDVRLVFKTHGGFEKNPEEGELTGEERRAAEFLHLCQSDERVILLDSFMSHDEIVSLISSCDVYLSMSRAEGLGLPVLEAMALGVPTMCVAYAGHTDFVAADCNVLVPFDLVEVPDSASHYFHPRQYPNAPHWAQPRVAEAADLMRELADDVGLRERVGVRGAAAARSYRERCEASSWVRDLVDAVSSPEVQAAHPQREADYQRLARSDRKVWLQHQRDVRRARRALRLRTRLGSVRRTARSVARSVARRS